MLGSVLLAPALWANPSEALRVEKSFETALDRWKLQTRLAQTPQEAQQAYAARPDPARASRDMWNVIGSSLAEEWTIEPAAWFLRVASGVLSTPEGGGAPQPAYAAQMAEVRKALETHHLLSPRLTAMCMALVTTQDPQAIAVLEKIQTRNPDKKVQGVAALAGAMLMKRLGDEPEVLRRRLTLLRTAIIESSDVEVGGVSVASIAENELYIIRHLSKGTVAPNLVGTDSAGRPLSIADLKEEVIMLAFWSNTDPEAKRFIELSAETVARMRGKSFALIGVNHDPLPKLRELEANEIVTWRNFTDSEKKLAREYRVASWPIVYVLGPDRKIAYSGAPGSFAELTAQALLDRKPTTQPSESSR